ncbi:hypothetical protein SAMN02745866_02978 [Alteromonadaceae bacterium Bs31]|nr:hypothetical protein SAMN02745866_02978 [Alteromonadaceae bacterium Bs31]
MKKLVILIIVIATGYHFYMGHSISTNENGFIEVVMPEGKSLGTVYILAPLNCPKEAGKRADLLESRLLSLGIPVARSSNGNVRASGNTKEDKNRFRNAVSVLKDEIPAVFINGMAKANPTVDEVVAEYRRDD